VRRLKLLEGRELSDGKLAGVGGAIAVKKGRVASLELGGVKLADVEAMFAIQAGGIEGSGGPRRQHRHARARVVLC
jgi:hypothetical protein